MSPEAAAELRHCTRPLTALSGRSVGPEWVLEEVCRIWEERRIPNPEIRKSEAATRAVQLYWLLVAEREALVREAVSLLPTVERRVIRLRYWEEETFQNIGLKMGFQNSYAQQVHVRALDRLRIRLLARFRKENPIGQTARL